MTDTGSARNGNDRDVPRCDHSEIELSAGKMRSSLKGGLLFMFHGKLPPVEKIAPWLSEIIWYNVTSAREPKACLHASGERRGNRVAKS